MNTSKLLAVLALVLLSTSVEAREHSDIIVMKNGDHFTGEIKGSDAGVLYVDLDYIDGTVPIQWSKVAHLESRQRFMLETQEGKVYIGTLRSLEGRLGLPMQVRVSQSPEREVAVDGPKVVKLDQTSQNFWRRLNGAVDFGATYSKGNQSTQYNLGSETEYLRERWRAEASLDSILSSSTATNASTRNDLAFGAAHLLPWRQYFYSGVGNFLQSSEQGIKLQANVGAGIGRYFKNTNHTVYQF